MLHRVRLALLFVGLLAACTSTDDAGETANDEVAGSTERGKGPEFPVIPGEEACSFGDPASERWSPAKDGALRVGDFDVTVARQGQVQRLDGGLRRGASVRRRARLEAPGRGRS